MPPSPSALYNPLSQLATISWRDAAYFMSFPSAHDGNIHCTRTSALLLQDVSFIQAAEAASPIGRLSARVLHFDQQMNAGAVSLSTPLRCHDILYASRFIVEQGLPVTVNQEVFQEPKGITTATLPWMYLTTEEGRPRLHGLLKKADMAQSILDRLAAHHPRGR